MVRTLCKDRRRNYAAGVHRKAFRRTVFPERLIQILKLPLLSPDTSNRNYGASLQEGSLRLGQVSNPLLALALLDRPQILPLANLLMEGFNVLRFVMV
jgi:hypothetical protein